VERAIERSADGATSSRPAAGGAAGADTPAPLSADPSRLAADLRADYQSYLEQRVTDGDQRISTLEAYLAGLWGVRLRRWVGGLLARRRI
jgi:hypothetical protein